MQISRNKFLRLQEMNAVRVMKTWSTERNWQTLSLKEQRTIPHMVLTFSKIEMSNDNKILHVTLPPSNDAVLSS